MPLAKNGRFIVDPWRHLADDEAPGEAQRISVSQARWASDRDALIASGRTLGLRLPNTLATETIAADLRHVALIVLSFPRFTDGRAYSQARKLRGRFGYRGELRAAGEVLRDQLLFMQRCGFDAFALPERAVAENWLAALSEFDVFYQPAEDHRPWLARRRVAIA